MSGSGLFSLLRPGIAYALFIVNALPTMRIAKNGGKYRARVEMR